MCGPDLSEGENPAKSCAALKYRKFRAMVGVKVEPHPDSNRISNIARTVMLWLATFSEMRPELSV